MLFRNKSNERRGARRAVPASALTSEEVQPRIGQKVVTFITVVEEIEFVSKEDINSRWGVRFFESQHTQAQILITPYIVVI